MFNFSDNEKCKIKTMKHCFSYTKGYFQGWWGGSGPSQTAAGRVQWYNSSGNNSAIYSNSLNMCVFVDPAILFLEVYTKAIIRNIPTDFCIKLVNAA